MFIDGWNPPNPERWDQFRRRLNRHLSHLTTHRATDEQWDGSWALSEVDNILKLVRGLASQMHTNGSPPRLRNRTGDTSADPTSWVGRRALQDQPAPVRCLSPDATPHQTARARSSPSTCSWQLHTAQLFP